MCVSGSNLTESQIENFKWKLFNVMSTWLPCYRILVFLVQVFLLIQWKARTKASSFIVVVGCTPVPKISSRWKLVVVDDLWICNFEPNAPNHRVFWIYSCWTESSKEHVFIAWSPSKTYQISFQSSEIRLYQHRIANVCEYLCLCKIRKRNRLLSLATRGKCHAVDCKF